MDIYFQEGEFANSGSDWVSVIIQLVGFAITIFAAYYGAKKAINLQINKEEKEKKKDLQERFNFLNSLAKRANKSIILQVGFIKEFEQNIVKKPSCVHEHKRIALEDVKRVLILLNEEKTFQAYLQKLEQDSERYENYNQLVYLLDYYYNGLNSIIKNIEITSKEIHEKREIFSKHFSQFVKILLHLIDNAPFKEDLVFSKIKEILGTHGTKDERTDLELGCAKLIYPAQGYLENCKITSPLINEAIGLAKDCHNFKQEIVELNLEYATFFNERHKDFSAQLEKLNALIQKLNVQDVAIKLH